MGWHSQSSEKRSNFWWNIHWRQLVGDSGNNIVPAADGKQNVPTGSIKRSLMLIQTTSDVHPVVLFICQSQNLTNLSGKPSLHSLYRKNILTYLTKPAFLNAWDTSNCMDRNNVLERGLLKSESKLSRPSPLGRLEKKFKPGRSLEQFSNADWTWKLGEGMSLCNGKVYDTRLKWILAIRRGDTYCCQKQCPSLAAPMEVGAGSGQRVF